MDIEEKRGAFIIFNISDRQFRDIMGAPRFSLPMRWNGQDFEKTLSTLFEEYIKALAAVGKDVDCQEKIVLTFVLI